MVFSRDPDFSDGSLFIAGGGGGSGAEDFAGGITRLLEEQKGGSVVTENPKGGSLKTLEGIRGGTTQICLENEDIGEGGGENRESHQMLLGGSLQ